MEIKQLYDEMRSAWEEMKHLGEQQGEEIKSLGTVTGETKAALERVNAKIAELEAEMKRPGLGALSQGETSKSETKDALLAYCRKGWDRMPAEQKKLFTLSTSRNVENEVKALSLSDDTTGGFLAPSEFANEIIKNVVLFSPVRGLARIRTTSNRSVQLPKRTGVMSAKWVGEVQKRDETGNPAYGLEEVHNHELFAEVIVSIQDLEDSAFDLEAEIRSDAAEQIGVAEGAAFLSGNGVNKPEGMLFNAAVAQDKSGDAAALTSDGLIKMAYALKSAYAGNATWLMNRATVGAIRLLTVGGTQGNYLWQPGLQAGAPSLILDRPYVECPDMPDVAAGATPILFGDIRRAYTIVDRVQMSFKRLEEKYADYGQVAVMVRKRVGGQVVLPEAIRKMVVSA